MEFILIAWFSMAHSDTSIAPNASKTPFSLATSITQEFNSQEACESAGLALQKTGVKTTYKSNYGMFQPEWNWVCSKKGKKAQLLPEPTADQ